MSDTSDDGTEERSQISPRTIQVVATIAVIVATIGFFKGTSEPDSSEGLSAYTGKKASGTGSHVVPSYLDMSASRPTIHQTELTLPAEAKGDWLDTDPESRQARRAQARAFEGAPPTIPHPIAQQSAPACLACHDKGALVAGKLAPAISHRAFASCTQCHVAAQNPVPGSPDPALTNNAFVGAVGHGKSTRAWSGAPPTMPHPAHMRERCESCHSPAGTSPIMSSHPTRKSCRQCHVGSAGQEQTQPTSYPPRDPWSGHPPTESARPAP